MSEPKTLLLIRHAKSSWKDASLADRDRPLNKRGKRDAPEMGRRIAARNLIPDLVVCSPATRALVTARTISNEIGYSRDEIVIDEELYGAAPQDLFDMVSLFDEQHQTAIVVGHNPTLTEVANHFSSVPIDNVPTCGLVIVQLTAWNCVEDRAILVDFDYPKRPLRDS